MTRWILAAVVSAAVISTACGDGGKADATAALGAVQDAFDAVRTEASTYVPEQEDAVADALAKVTYTLGTGDYDRVLNDAAALWPRVAAMEQAVIVKKTELTSTWAALSTSVPGAIPMIEARVETLSTAKTLPAVVSKDSLVDARAGLAAMNDSWTAAADAFRRGNLADAVRKGRHVQARASEVMISLGMTVPASF
jgi:hypothetical protein